MRVEIDISEKTITLLDNMPLVQVEQLVHALMGLYGWHDTEVFVVNRTVQVDSPAPLPLAIPFSPQDPFPYTTSPIPPFQRPWVTYCQGNEHNRTTN